MSAKAGKRLSFHQNWLGRPERLAVQAALRAGNLGGNGPACRRVEARLAATLKIRRAFLTPSGTAALELALMALRLKPGDEVILPSFTFVSDANAVLRQGCVPVFADVEPSTLNLDPRDVRRRITPRTRAIVLVHYAGMACDMGAFLKLKRRHGLALIEDAALGLGASWRGRPLGGIGDLGCFSFHATKQVVCGEGGALVTRRADLAARIEVMQEKGTDRGSFLRGERDRYTWRDVGSSYVMSDLLAALLEAQLARLPAIQARLLGAWKGYRRLLEPLERRGWLRLPRPRPDSRPNGNMFWMVLEGPWRGRRDEVLARLRSRGVPAAFHYVPLHDSPYGRAVARRLAPRLRAGRLPVTEAAARDLVRLPMHARLGPAQVRRVAAAVAGCLQGAGRPMRL